MIKIIIYYSALALILWGIHQTEFAQYLHADLLFIFVFLAFQSYLTLSLGQIAQRNEGEKFVQVQTASFAIRFILSILFIGFFAYSHTPEIYLFIGNFFVLYLCSSNFEIFGLLRNLRRF